tara:strand:- start:133 stop:285 length:153 start_codon:yes stop_codon:yes gene_type:complete
MKTYKIIRFFSRRGAPSVVIKRGLTLEQAQAHCKDPATSGDTWFDGYEEE